MIKATSDRVDSGTADLERFWRESLRLGGQALRDWWRPSLEFSRTLWAGYAAGRPAGGCGGSVRPYESCAIPETDCPPRCVCELRWEAQPHETVRGTLRVVNTGQQRRQFTFAATNLTSDGLDSGVAPSLAPSAADLAPQEAVTAQVSIPLRQGFETGRTYRGEILVRGLYEQCVRVAVQVEPEPRPHCEVRQGEIPVRVRAHRWYHHFQCEEPCFEPVGRISRGDDQRREPVA